MSAFMDAASGIDVPIAFGAGLISFLSPCVLPLVPGYLSAIAGEHPEHLGTTRVIRPALGFVLSFSAIFIGLGLIGQRALRLALTGPATLKISGAVIIVLGLIFVLAPFVPVLSRSWHVDGLVKRAGAGGPVLVGAAFALAWLPCTGPTLGAITAAAGTSSSAAQGAALLAVYCAGLGLPFVIVGLAFGTATSSLAIVKRHYPIVIFAGGAILVFMGILVFTGEFTQINVAVSHWLNSLGVPNLSGDT